MSPAADSVKESMKTAVPAYVDIDALIDLVEYDASEDVRAAALMTLSHANDRRVLDYLKSLRCRDDFSPDLNATVDAAIAASGRLR